MGKPPRTKPTTKQTPPTLLAMAIHLHRVPKAAVVTESRLAKGTVDRLAAGTAGASHPATWIALALALTRLLGREISPAAAQKLVETRVKDLPRAADEIDRALGAGEEREGEQPSSHPKRRGRAGS